MLTVLHEMLHKVLHKWYADIVAVSSYERLKIGLLTLSFFCIVSCYTILRELRDTLFISLVGRVYLNYAQIISLVLLVPGLFLYSYLIDRLQKHQVLYFYTILYGLGTFLIAYSIADPACGINLCQPSPFRFLGWVQYLFIEGYSPFVISHFLALVNSITTLQSAPWSYSCIVGGSKFGGMIIAASAWAFLRYIPWSDGELHKYLLIGAGFLILLVPLLIYYLIKKVPADYLQGYQGTTSVITSPDKNLPHKKSSGTGIITGLTTMIKYPYALGMFGLVFFWQVTSVVINYQRLSSCIECHSSLAGLSSVLFSQVFWMHGIGFMGAVLGTNLLLRGLGERKSLIAIPLMTGFLLCLYFSGLGAWLAYISYVVIRALNYSVALAAREILYIPTSKALRFKTKSWIDAFGTKMALATGSCYNLLIDRYQLHSSGIYWWFIMIIISSWSITAHLLGHRFESAVKKNEVIGEQE